MSTLLGSTLPTGIPLRGNAQAVQPAVPARVWLADDSAVEVEHTRTLLSRAAHQVETFSDGASLLERLEQPGVELPEVLLLDWLMPGITGLEVCRFLRDRYGPTDLPILVLTASTHEGALEEAFAAGANDYVAKPARAVELLARVRTLLQTRRDTEALRTRERDRARLLVEAEAERTRLTIVLSTLEEGVMLHDVRGVVSFSNAAAERLLGLTAEQLAGRTPADPHWGAVHEDGTPFPGEEHASMRALRTGQGIVGVTMGVRHADGRLVWLSINAQPYFEQDKRTLAGVVSSFADITVQVHARHRLESLAQQLRESEEHLRRVVESSGTGIWEMDTATETLVTDARFREMFGLSPDEPFPLEKGISIIHPEDRPRVARNLSAALAGDEGGRFRAEYRTVRGSDGR
ncbi:MAG TPA: PAS domain S-box protein, partial [Myxococcaceae bacterium]